MIHFLEALAASALIVSIAFGVWLAVTYEPEDDH